MALSPSKLRKEADRLRAEASKLEELRERADALEALADDLDHRARGGEASKPKPGGRRHRLQHERDVTTLPTEMDAMSVATKSQRISRTRLTAEENARHPFVVALLAAGKSVREFAKEVDVPYSTVMSWYAKNPIRTRPIPMRIALKARDELSVPLEAWAKLSP